MRQIGSHSTVHFSAAAASSASVRDSASRAASTPASRWRWSSSSAVSPAIAVTTPGCRPRRRWSTSPPWRTARVAHREREARCREERVAPVGHRRRAGVGGLPAEDHAVALDADRAEHRPDRQAEALEHRPLLDVQLEVGAHVPQPRAPPRARGRASTPCAASASSSRIAVGVAQVAHGVGIERPADRRGAEAGCARSARPPRRPSPRASRCRAGCPPPRSRAGSRARAITPSAPSSQPPFGTESMCEPITTVSGRSPARRAQRLPASSTSTSTGSSASALAQQSRARSPTRPSSTAGAPRRGRRSARRARADRRSRAAADRRSPSRPSPRTGG